SAVKGFSLSCAPAGIKYKNRDDVLLITSELPFNTAAVFTENKVKAESLQLCKKNLEENSQCKAVIVNSGNANACNGEEGIKGARSITEKLSEALNVRFNEVLIASTGVIGEKFPADKIIQIIPQLIQNKDKHDEITCAKSIMTTDLFPKISSIKVNLSGTEVNIGGLAKGAGMISPNMGTMLAFIATDAKIETPLLKEILKDCVNSSFNRITVDGDTSTNDTVILMANGASEMVIRRDSDDYNSFKQAVQSVFIDLAKMIVRDGEGATKLVNIIVKDTFSVQDALIIARKIANSPLVKTALHGEDPNWGRILAAAGNTEIAFEYKKASLFIGDVTVLDKGEVPENYDEKKSNAVMKNKEFDITLSCGNGFHSANIWTSDLTKEYISINADYRS
ncbi:MAG: bifunctional glutamate N-acetyltransferase/amino-acid acetyltransferase ArgJ, partial [Nitrospinae bacterium]|nr:bifunctional glutamate N-acetyltransferase/amino-acid acetyltransferase ArgJ [Nitrospinota bacterium]